MEDYDYSFSQNGLVAYKGGKLIAEQVGAVRVTSSWTSVGAFVSRADQDHHARSCSWLKALVLV